MTDYTSIKYGQVARISLKKVHLDIRVQRAAYFRDLLSFRKMTFAECIEFSSQNTLAIERII